jgi:diguanylate cyclase (GGDEF)-like protein
MSDPLSTDRGDSRHIPHTGTYAGANFAIARTFSGASLLAGSVLILCLLPFYPPTPAIGGFGWVVTGACLTATIGIGAAILARRIRPYGTLLLISSYVAVSMLAGLAWLAGGAPAPYWLLSTAVLVPAAMLQPARRLMPFALFVVAVSLFPLVAGQLPGNRAGELVVQIVLALAISGALARVMIEVRQHRLDARAENTRANTLARIDGLTGLGNRRAFEEAARRELPRARREAKPLTLVMVDLDGFKSVNDEFGHLGGDSFLCAVADAFTRSIRPSDLIFRWAGDEFAMLLPDADEAAAAEIVARWHARVRVVTRASGRGIEFSAGAATARGDAKLDALVRTADAAMYRQKPGAQGRAPGVVPAVA